MLIQSTANLPQVQQAATSPSSDGGASVAASSIAARIGVSLELPQTAAKPVAGEQMSDEQAKSVVGTINRVLKQSNKNLEFSVDEVTNRQVFKLKDAETGDVIRQYPTEEMLAISHAIDMIREGLLLKQEA